MMLSFSWKGCQICVGFSCFALLAFCCLFLGAGSSAFVFAAAACHETGHLLLLFWLKAPPSLIKLTALGCRMVPNQGRILPYKQMALVSLAGPGMNLLCAGSMALFAQENHPFYSASLILGILHVLPVEPLDGGLAFHALLCAWMKRERDSKVSMVVSVMFLLPMGVLGFLILLRTRYNFTLLAMSLYLMLYLVLKRDYLTG